MKKQLAALILFTMALGTLQLPARADLNVTFGKHDRNHDGRWTYEEFNDANRNYYRQHHDEKVMSQRDLHREFKRLDKDNNGYLTKEEVQTYHNWE